MNLQKIREAMKQQITHAERQDNIFSVIGYKENNNVVITSYTYNQLLPEISYIIGCALKRTVQTCIKPNTNKKEKKQSEKQLFAQLLHEMIENYEKYDKESQVRWRDQS